MSEYLRDYYEKYDEEGRLVSRHGSVEFLTTMKYIERYSQAGHRVLEIGAGTGRYSHALARQGYEVDAVELIEHNIEIFRKNTSPDEKISIVQGDARDLKAFADNTYDITLVLGPMYHLFTKEDKLKVISEAIRVTKSGGVVFIAYCISDASLLSACFAKNRIHEFMHLIDPLTFKTHSNLEDIFVLYRKEEIDELMADFTATRLHYVAADGYARHMIETMAAWDDEMFELYLQYHFATCEREDMAGISHHVLDIFRKD